MLRSRLLPFVWVVGLPGIIYGQCEPNQYSPLSIIIQVPGGQVIPTYYVRGGSCAGPGDRASDNGGPKVVNGELELIFWGHDWQTAVNPGQADISAAIQSILRGPYLSRLTQYGFVSVQLDSAKSILSDPPATYALHDVAEAVWGAINAGDLPQPNAFGMRFFYMVLAPSSATFNQKNPAYHLAAPCAWARPSDTRCSGATDSAWIGIVTGQSLDPSTMGFSHELVEMITDPELNTRPAWQMNRDFVGEYEIGDACNPLQDRLDGIQVAAYWSNVDNACVIPRGPINYHSAKPQTITALSGPPAAAHTRMQHVYGRKANGETLHYKWSTCGQPDLTWAADSLPKLANKYHPELFYIKDNLVAADGPDKGTQHVFGRNAAGQFIHFYSNPGRGGCVDQGENVTQDIAQRFPNSGDFTFASDLNILNAPNSYVEHAFARNSANQLIHYWYLADVEGWGAENLTTKYPNCPECRIFGNLAVINGGDNTTQHAFGTNANNELIQYWWDPWSSWHGENLTARTNIGPAFRIVSDLAAINDASVGDPNFAPDQIGQNVFGRSANGELIHYYWYPQQSWHAEKPTQTAISSSDIHFSDSLVAVNSGLLQYVFARNANNELIYYQRFTNNFLWRAGNATRGLDHNVFQIAGDLHAVADANSWGVHVYWRNASNELIHYWMDPGKPYDSSYSYVENVTARWPHVGSTFNIVDGLTAVIGPDGDSQHVFGKNANGELVHYYRNASGVWRAEDLTYYPYTGPAYTFN